MRNFSSSLLLCSVLSLSLFSGCARFSSYSNPEAPWRTIERVAVLPIRTPSDNPVRRQLVTQLFIEELRQVGFSELVELPLSGLLEGEPDLKRIARDYQVDAVFSGSIDDSQGTVIHIQLHDPATEEILWSGTYLLGSGAEFFSLHTQQQQFQRSLHRLAQEVSEKHALAQ